MYECSQIELLYCFAEDNLFIHFMDVDSVLSSFNPIENYIDVTKFFRNDSDLSGSDVSDLDSWRQLFSRLGKK